MISFNIHKIQSLKIALLTSDSDNICNVDDAMDLLGNADYLGCRHIFVRLAQLSQDFFKLNTGLAGAILQKFSTYRMFLAIEGDFSHVPSKSLSDFIYESNKQGRIIFVNSLDEAGKLFYQ